MKIEQNNEIKDVEVATCPVCGEKYVPAPQHAYRVGYKRNGRPLRRVCSYHCVLAYERAHDKEAKG